MKPFEENDRYVYNLPPDSVVLDCGGYNGDFAAGIYERYGCTIHVLEPVGEFFARIHKRFSDNPKIHVHHFGIGYRTDTAIFKIKGDMTGEFADNPKQEVVDLKSVHAIFNDIGSVSLLKLNIEGSEFCVLEEMVSTGITRKAQNIQCQWHDVVPNAQSRYDALQKKLAETHFLTFDHGWVWQNWRLNEQ